MLFRRTPLAILFGAPVLANAQAPAGSLRAAQPENGFYVGAGFGYGGLILEDDAPSTNDLDGEDPIVRAFAGYRLFPALAIEASYVDHGSPEEGPPGTSTVQIPGGGTIQGPSFFQQGRLETFGLSAVGMWPLGPVDLFGKAGIARWDGSYQTITQTGISVTNGVVTVTGGDTIFVSQHGFAPTVGIGAQYRYRHLAVRAEFEGLFLSFDDDNSGRNDGRDVAASLSLSVIWSF